MPIQILPDEVASQIAAGEVVERPASVVKELIENSLDAEASHISITVEGAGQKLIEVADDGFGIPAEELVLALSRHATSKLSTAADLFNIATLGFRGEALASIASVSRFTLTSRPKEAEMGARLLVEGGQIESEPQPVGAPAGTVVRVEDLFYNLPARRKFLKTDRTERRQIDDLVTRYALAYPDVRIHLHQEGRSALQTSGSGDRREVLASLFSADIARQMLEVNAEYHDHKVYGFISPTSLTRSNRRGITLFINGRWVQDIALSTALIQGYHSMLMVGRYPMAVIFIDLPPNHVDVNVHPTKSEVRFTDRDTVFSNVQRAVRRALLAYSPVPPVQGQVRWTPPERQPGFDQGGWQRAETDSDQPSQSRDQLAQDEASSPPVQASLSTGDVPLLRLIGQVGSAYLVAEGPDGLYLVDQHAAHERILFERFMAQRQEEIPSQTLLDPATVELDTASARLLEEHIEVMERLGFEIEPFGPNTYKVRRIPVLLAGSDPVAAVRAVIEDFEEDETPLQNEIEAVIIGRVCKRAAVKAGKVLSPEEQKALLLDLEACQSPRTCPHGRPTMIHLSIDLLERQFGRTGAR
ncbi:MAG: DNA mismatch repair endonuclease MutL [candidate division Zixibacteria bacterium]|nr:DNA mismatch repair endonuclease MutL [Gammaproteobacteria bacterium]NIX56774.1 DNA mismatch repair endonuclease MutL [candidate division Zixibacteria bacterium]